MNGSGSGSGSGCRSGDAYTDWVLASALPLFPSTYFGTRFIDRPAWGRTKVRLPYCIGTILYTKLYVLRFVYLCHIADTGSVAHTHKREAFLTKTYLNGFSFCGKLNRLSDQAHTHIKTIKPHSILTIIDFGPASAAGECVHVRRGLCRDGAGCFLPCRRDTNVHVSTHSAQHSTAQQPTHSSTQHPLPLLSVHYRI